MLPPGVTLYGVYEYDAAIMDALQCAVEESLIAASFSKQEAQQWREAMVFHHQWLVVSVKHARVLVERREEIMNVSGGGWLGGCKQASDVGFHDGCKGVSGDVSRMLQLAEVQF